MWRPSLNLPPLCATEPMSGNRFHWSWSHLRQIASAIWSLLRRLSGDDAYDRYVEHTAFAHVSELPLSKGEFEHQRQERKWSRISRCC